MSCAALALVNDLLDLERVGSGQLAIEKQHCVRATAVGVSLQSGPTAVQLHADPERLTQVVINLLANAVRLSPRGGTVTVRVTQDAHRVRMTIDDQGPGVPEPFRQAIFEPFKQVEGSAAHKKGGTGLGMAISHAIVTAHDGVLDVADAPGGGARFWFDLPI